MPHQEDPKSFDLGQWTATYHPDGAEIEIEGGGSAKSFVITQEGNRLILVAFEDGSYDPIYQIDLETGSVVHTAQKPD